MRLLPIQNNFFAYAKKERTIGTQKSVPDIKQQEIPAYFSIPFGQIIFKSINPKYSSLEEELKKETDTFSNSQANATYIGSGISAEAFILTNFPNIVIKRPYNNSVDFSEEEHHLSCIPDGIEHVQRFVATAYDDEKQCSYLLSEKIQGTSPDLQDMPWTKKHLESLFETLFQMDCAGLYHGDLNNGNLKLTEDGSANIIDFQWTHTVLPDDFFKYKRESILPDFIFPENSQMFEMAEIPYYLRKVENEKQAKEFLTMYLQQKANYHKERYSFVLDFEKNNSNSWENETIQKAKSFERAQAAVFQNPTDDILKLEAKKIEFLNYFRQAFKYIDGNTINKNILEAPSAYLIAFCAIQDFRCEVYKNMEKINETLEKEGDADGSLTTKADYLKGLDEYGDFWFNEFYNWLPQIFSFPYKHARNELDWWEALYDFNNPDVDFSYFDPMTSILQKFGNDFMPHYSQSVSFIDDESDYMMNGNRENIQTLMNETVFDTEINEKAAEIEKIQTKLEKAYYSNRWPDIINLSLLGILRSRQIYEMTSSILSDEFHNDNDCVRTANNISLNLISSYSKFASDYFNRASFSIQQNNPFSEEIFGYNNMENFN